MANIIVTDRRRSRALLLSLGCAVAWSLLASQAWATWSIIIIDTVTKEIAVGSATCLTKFDLQAELPVVMPDVGAACAQSFVDFDAVNRMRIHTAILSGMRPGKIIELLAANDSIHQRRQYGIATVDGRAITFTGAQTSEFSDGVVGKSGSLVYTIQGNILTGAPVVEMAEQALLATPGDLPEKLMAAMEAARAMGGDGRCSCHLDPEGCGSPPISPFDKAAHIGFMTVARTGDTDGVCTADLGCANGDYFLNFNVANQTESDPDPVFQLRELFDAWRADLIDQTDAVQSSALIGPPSFLADGNGSATLTITLRDWQGTPVLDESLAVTVEHAGDSDLTTTAGPVISDGRGVFHVELTGSDRVGRDRFVVTVEGGARPLILLPHPSLLSFAHSDLDRDGDVDGDDHAAVAGCLTGPASPTPDKCDMADLDSDGYVGVMDFSLLQREYTAAACVELFIDEPPERLFVICFRPFTLRVMVTADPPASFQWFFEDAPIPGATEAEYSVEFAGNEHFGHYFVQVTNTCGTLTSDSVRVDPSRPCP